MGTVPMTAKELMEECVVRMKANADQMKGIDAKVGFDFLEDGKYSLEIIDGAIQPVIEGIVEKPRTVFTGNIDTWYKVVISNEMTGVQASIMNLLKISGDPSLGMRLAKWTEKK